MNLSEDFIDPFTVQNINSTNVEEHGMNRPREPFVALFIYGSDVIVTLCLLFFVLGIPANVMNIIVYSRTGVRDNITVPFLALSVSDLGYLVTLSPHVVTRFLEHMVEYRMRTPVNWLADPRATSFPFYWYSFVFYDTSILINVYIAVVRCACVAIPFKVKSTFTTRRAIIAFTAFFFSVFLLRIPMIMKKRIVREFDAVQNKTRVVFREFDDGGLAERINDIFNRNILNWFSYITVISCLVVMVTKLQASARFRSSVAITNPTQASVAGGSKNPETAHILSSQHDISLHSEKKLSHNQDSVCSPSDKLQHHSHSKQTTAYNNQNLKKNIEIKPKSLTSQLTWGSGKNPVPLEKGKQVLSTRETQVLRSVIMVAVVFILCQFPLMSYTLARQIESQFDNTRGDGKVKKYRFLFAFFSNLSTVFAYINSSVNMLVYYKFNSRYRHSMKALWKRNVSGELKK
ncbi:chemosensory receptor C [Elysia marginata]|uniref:Chemosensory receptor C n=1 Tax=Elysia marginata TaxID=1093978 RepID=A0AAV4HQM7_9GAST|nr:chemosensory receptor C [Elysia marginata]